MRAVRVLLLASVLAGLVWFSFFNSASAREVAGLALDGFDSRPARSVLFIGNSRTYPHAMPYMVREMADSAAAPEKYQIRMHALPGRSLQEHWRDPDVQALLARHWDDVVLQERSGMLWNRDGVHEFRDYGARLVRQVAERGGRPVMFVGWTYGPGHFRDMFAGARLSYHRHIQDEHLRLARSAHARRANVGEVWLAVEAVDPPFRLDTDGNHPSLHGAYLTALVIYARLSGGDVAAVTYVPDGLPQEDAALLRRLAGAALRSAT